MATNNNDRIAYIDVAKGLLILLVIFDHLPDVFLSVLNKENLLINSIDDGQWVFKCFFMPAFFIITGFCSSFDRSFGPFVLKNFKALVIPSLIFTILSIALYSIVHHSSIDLFIVFRHLLKYGGNYWFLISLFLSKCLYWLIVRFINRSTIRIVILLLLLAIGFYASTWSLINTYDVWYWHYAFSLLIFIELGQLLRHHNYDKHNVLLSFLFVFSVIAVYLLGFRAPVVAMNFSRSIFEIPAFLYFAITGSIMILTISKLFEKIKILQYMGRMSIILYVLQIDVLTYVESFILQYLSLNSVFATVVFLIVSLFSALSIMLLLSYLINLKYLKLMLGKF